MFIFVFTDAGEITVEVQLNGEQSTIEFLDPPGRIVSTSGKIINK